MQIAVVRDNRADLVPVTLGRDYGTEVEVVSGVSADDSIVENPSDSLTSGTRVEAVQAKEQ
jgi:hypothetical protein